MIVAAGSLFGGWSFYLKDGRPVAYAAVTQLPGQQFRVAAEKPLAVGPNKLRFDFEAAGQGGVMRISVNGTEIAHGELPMRPRTLAGLGETFDIGRDSNTPVSDEYQDEGVFTGVNRQGCSRCEAATGRLVGYSEACGTGLKVFFGWQSKRRVCLKGVAPLVRTDFSSG